MRIGFHGDEEKTWYEDQNQAPSWFVEQVSSLVEVYFFITLKEQLYVEIMKKLEIELELK